MPVVVLRSAKDDLRDGYLFYENQEPGVGDYFSDTHPMTYSLHYIAGRTRAERGKSAAGASVAISGGGGVIVANVKMLPIPISNRQLATLDFCTRFARHVRFPKGREPPRGAVAATLVLATLAHWQHLT